MPQTSEHPWSGLVSFWRQAGEDKWFGKDLTFDDACRDRFRELHMDVATRRHDDWMDTAEGAFALILLTDQIPRNIFRGSAHMFATDPLARHYARRALAVGYPGQVDADLRVFFALPFTHSEDMADQALSVALTNALAGTSEWAESHRDIIRRFGRFPHRNALLLRETTTAEAEFLAAGGFAG
ncbi:MAG TPA: DUF924 family protein [Rhodopila sp.]|jgi:uncharacterized protein (DUF924 family)|nr:DUF924 family protein [Rhodopila sp.]